MAQQSRLASRNGILDPGHADLFPGRCNPEGPRARDRLGPGGPRRFAADLRRPHTEAPQAPAEGRRRGNSERNTPAPCGTGARRGGEGAVGEGSEAAWSCERTTLDAD